ncbi:hypothetical protein DM806_08565 [Sphingobium lactosutens]|uniref:DUF418 domain-containing protein n=1 Tax=Sphingobium lactosutens TaxID=522773 RepID=UPI0015BD9481|nr:DUF418 domain-containing protein [Sphingobium lactosutens]NWK95726.1 hypothetical protein [Sphingobium lactosutens]
MTASPRIPAMDVLRGCAVMGIVWMNITAYALPQNAYFNPAVAGPLSAGDMIFWAISLIFVDGKMRGLFALLFGASMLLLIDKEEMAGRDGRRTQMIRLGWLFVIGCLHFFLLWWGDILRVYAIVGLFALLFVRFEPLDLVKRAFLFFLFQFLLLAAFIGSLYLWGHAAGEANVGAATRDGFLHFMAALSDPTSPTTQMEIATYRSSLSAIIGMKLAGFPGDWLWGLLFNAFETLGFMLLGMAMLKGGFLTGNWDAEQYRRTARHCFLIGVPPMAALGLWVWWSGFAPLPTYGAALVWSLPFRIPLTVGWAALILWLLARHKGSPMVGRIAAAGRMTLSNYLGTSLVMTTIFYGWGIGLFAHVDHATLPLFVFAIWVVMLLWSQPYAVRFAMGPAEWLWRSLSHGAVQKIRRSS